MSLETILPFLQPIAHLITDGNVSEIMLNPDGRIFIERAGKMEEVEAAITPENAEFALKRIAHMADRQINESEPLLEVRLPDGSRVTAVCPPITKTWTFAIRKHSPTRFTLDSLVKLGTLTPAMKNTLKLAVEDRQTILVSGGTSAGKTSLLNALCAALPEEDRIVCIEDTAEIQLHGRNVFCLEARPARSETKAITIRDLVKTSLRLRPDRLIVGEVRGAEAFDLLQALNSGHSGSMSTIHANSSEQALYKLSNLAAMSGDIPLASIKPMITDAIQMVVQITRKNGMRIVTQLTQVNGYDRGMEMFRLSDLVSKGTTDAS